MHLKWFLPLLVVLQVTGCGSVTSSSRSAALPVTSVEEDRVREGDQVLATVGRDVITDAELKRRILERYYGPRALNGLVRESLFSAEAERLGIRIDAEQIASAVADEMERILGSNFESKRRALLQLEEQGLLESDLRREISQEVGPALLIQAVIAHHREVDEEQLLDLWRATWKEHRRLVDHIFFPIGEADEETRAEIEQWASRTVEVLASGTPLAAAVEKPLGLKSSFTPRTGTAWIRESELAGNPAFFKVFQASSGEVVGPLPEEGFGWHLMRVVESQPARSYSEMRPQLLQMWLAEPASDEELLAVERLIRSRFPVQIKGFDSR